MLLHRPGLPRQKTGRKNRFAYGMGNRTLNEHTADGASFQGIQQCLVILPKAEIMLQIPLQGPFAPTKGKAFILHQGMIDQRMKGAIFSGKITVEGFSRDIQLLTQIADIDILVSVKQHCIQKSFFQLALTGCRLFGFT